MAGEIRVGVSGWTFPGWQGTFYPKGLARTKELFYASQHLNSIEINGTFHAIQTPKTFKRWYETTPENFLFSVKASRYLTHEKRLKEYGRGLSNFFATGLLCLKHKLGPILWQFPPNMKLKDHRFEKFLAVLPHTSQAAAKLAEGYSEKLEDIVEIPEGLNFPVRHAFEFRHESFLNKDFIQMLQENNIALVFPHSPKKGFPYAEDLTSDFVYCRMHGEKAKYKKGYPLSEVEAWAKRVEAWAEGRVPVKSETVAIKKPEKVKRDVFVYFDNAEKLYAPKNALQLLKALDLAQPLKGTG